jgi:magnesium transporter
MTFPAVNEAANGSELLRGLARHYLVQFPADAAPNLEDARAGELAELLETLDAAARGEVLRRMNADAAMRALVALDARAAAATLASVEVTLAARWLALCDDEMRGVLLSNLPDKHAARIREALHYPPGTAGHLMDAGVVTFRQSTTIGAAFAMIRRSNLRVADVLVCDEDERLIGVVPLQELVGAPLDTSLAEVLRTSFVAVHAMTQRDEVVALLNRHRLASLPVLDLDGRVLGVIRYEGLVLAAQQEAAEDLQTMVGVGKEERALSPAWFTVKSRLPWLLVNLLTAFAAALVVGIFDETIARFTALAVLLPVVAGQSGNTGAQALAVTSRGLALREIRVHHWWRVLVKEMGAALGNGVAIAALTSGAVIAVSGNAGLAGVIGASMVLSMVLAAVAGAMTPIVLTAVGRDPATASSIILTTVTDIVGFFSFLGLATLFADALAG